MSGYEANNITVLEGLEAVRKRPAMYIGTTDEKGLHHLIYEVIDNSIDEAMAGFCDRVKVEVRMDNTVVIQDNGRGIPVDIHEKTGKTAVEVVMTTLHAGGKFNDNLYKYSGGLHGVGVSCVNALSEFLNVTVYRNGNMYRQNFERGYPVTELQKETDSFAYEGKSGTLIKFRPDPEIFSVLDFDYDTLSKRFAEIACLNPGLSIEFDDEKTNQGEKFYSEEGIKSFVSKKSQGKDSVTDIIHGDKEENGYVIDFALQYTTGHQEKVISFANNIRTMEGGTHLFGFKNAITRAFNSYVQQNDVKLKEKVCGDDIREGLTGVISIKLPEPQFEGQTKTKLGNSEVSGMVTSIVSSAFLEYLEKNPPIGKKLIEKVTQSAKAREAAKKARNMVRRKTKLSSTSLPGKLADCQSKDATESEIYIVEGDSAGGSAKQGRDPRFQAILPLRGKIRNVEKTSMNKILNNNEMSSLITSLGVGINNGDDNGIDLSKLRYHKVFIMTDADVDGAHIRTLLLTFFFRFYPEIIENGHLFVAEPPLYRIQEGKKGRFIMNDDEMRQYLFERVHTDIAVPCLENSNISMIDFLKNISIMRNALEKGYKLGVEKRFFDACLRYSYVNGKKLNHDFFADKDNRKDFINYFLQRCDKYNYVDVSFEEFEKDDGDTRYKIYLKDKNVHKSELYADFFASSVFQEAMNKFLVLKKICSEPFNFSHKKETYEATNFFDFYNQAIKYVWNNLKYQRYKGLGEMNPDQLWDTTMDPEHRKLNRVTVKDAEEADRVFTKLMGEQVEDRKNFIMKNALEVKELDV